MFKNECLLVGVTEVIANIFLFSKCVSECKPAGTYVSNQSIILRWYSTGIVSEVVYNIKIVPSVNNKLFLNMIACSDSHYGYKKPTKVSDILHTNKYETSFAIHFKNISFDMFIPFIVKEVRGCQFIIHDLRYITAIPTGLRNTNYKIISYVNDTDLCNVHFSARNYLYLSLTTYNYNTIYKHTFKISEQFSIWDIDEIC
ncbi:hypothetical protein GBBBJNDB_00211 [Pseudomonas phage Callisto]|nr:hypothetical protein GBBBJNDB_00211 [Pseudomonas phage Callisto]